MYSVYEIRMNRLAFLNDNPFGMRQFARMTTYSPRVNPNAPTRA